MAKRVRIVGKENDWYEEVVFMMKKNDQARTEANSLSEYANQLIGKHMKVGTLETIEAKKTVYRKEEVTDEWIDYFFWISIGMLGIVMVLYITSLLA